MAALVINSIGDAVITPTAKGVPDASVTITSPRASGDYYEVVVGATATTITVNRYGAFKAGDNEGDYVLTALTNTTRIIPITREFVNPATGNAVIDFSQTTNVTADLRRVAV